MSRRTQLVYRDEIQDSGSGSPVLIALHGYEGDSTQLLPVANALTVAGRVLTPEGPRPAVVYGRNAKGRSWYAMQGLAQPEPASFGDGLVEIEQCLLDTIEATAGGGENPPPIFLLGLDQGALLALSLACVWPEAVTGVAAICGYLPDIPGWTQDDRPLNGMPVLLVHDPEYLEVPASLQQQTQDRLITKGARVTVHTVSKVRELPSSLTGLLNTWMETTLFQ